jgi:hypothetical protein
VDKAVDEALARATRNFTEDMKRLEYDFNTKMKFNLDEFDSYHDKEMKKKSEEVVSLTEELAGLKMKFLADKK